MRLISPVHAGDELEHEVQLAVGAWSSYATIHEFRRGEHVVARGRLVRAFMDLETLHTAPVPARIRTAADGTLEVDHAALDTPSPGSRPRF